MEAKQLADKAGDVLTATIPNATDTSDAVLLYGATALAFQTPAALTGVTFTFQGSIDKGTSFKTIKDQNGNPITFTVAPDGTYPMDANIFAAYDQIKFVSDQNEAAERLILVKPFAV